MLVERWELSQRNMVGFVMVDATNNELAGLLGSLAGVLSKNGAAAGALAGTFVEIPGMVGHYTYFSTVAEANTLGIVNLQFTAVGAVRQNMEYTVIQRTPNAVPFDPAATGNGYQVVTAGGVPIENVDIIIRVLNDITADIVKTGQTNINGYIRDIYGNIPLVEPTTRYYVWRYRSGYDFNNPDTEDIP